MKNMQILMIALLISMFNANALADTATVNKQQAINNASRVQSLGNLVSTLGQKLSNLQAELDALKGCGDNNMLYGVNGCSSISKTSSSPTAGWWRDDNTGLIIQWGTGRGTINLPVPCPNGILNVVSSQNVYDGDWENNYSFINGTQIKLRHVKKGDLGPRQSYQVVCH